MGGQSDHYSSYHNHTFRHNTIHLTNLKVIMAWPNDVSPKYAFNVIFKTSSPLTEKQIENIRETIRLAIKLDHEMFDSLLPEDIDLIELRVLTLYLK